MEYSKKIGPKQKYENFGIWNIAKKLDHNKNKKILEYGIFKKIEPQQESFFF